MLYSMSSCIKTLCWAMILIFMLIYGFAIIFVQGVCDEIPVDGDADEPVHVAELRRYYGTLPRGMLSLYKSAIYGHSWEVALAPLLQVDASLFTPLFLAFISVWFLMMMNLLNAVFVESALGSQSHYKELMVHRNRAKKQLTISHMKEVFRQIDVDNSGAIDFIELDFWLKDLELRMYVESLGIGVDDTMKLFKLLDVDGSGEVDIEEFCDGLLKLQGEAKSQDVHLLIYEGRKLHKKLDKMYMHSRDAAMRMDQQMVSMRAQSGWLLDPPSPLSSQAVVTETHTSI